MDTLNAMIEFILMIGLLFLIITMFVLGLWAIWTTTIRLYKTGDIFWENDNHKSNLSYHSATIAKLNDDELILVWYRFDQERRARGAILEEKGYCP